MIPTRGRRFESRHLELDNDLDALYCGKLWAIEIGQPVLVCQAPLGGVVRDIATVGDFPVKSKKRG